MTSVEVRRTERFARWLDDLRDDRARARILVRIRRLSLGNPGDARRIGGGLCEVRVNYGPGYRVYFTQPGKVVFLFVGGDKKTQSRDIAEARAMAVSLSQS